MLVILGESASGKSSIEKELINKGFVKVISYTTRPIRQGEVDGVDYHYITVEEFEELDAIHFFAEKTVYNNYHYATAIEDCTDDKVIVVNPHGLRQLKQIESLHIKSFYIKVSQHERLIRIAKRGDDIMNIFKRIISDEGVFQNIEEEVDYIIENYDFEETMKEVLHCVYEDNI